MLPITCITRQFDEIINYFNNHEDDKPESIVKHIDAQVRNLIRSIPLGGLSIDSTKCLSELYFNESKFKHKTQIRFWEIYNQCNCYCLSYAEEKPIRLQELEATLQKQKSMLLLNRSVLDKEFIRIVYTSQCPELVALFQRTLPVPPLSIFPHDNQPKVLVEIASKKAELLAPFEAHHLGNPNLEEKIVSIQRRCRAKLREESELARIGQRYCPKEALEVQRANASAMIEDANTPYKPKCDPELSKRIQRAAAQVKIFSSFSHLLCAENSVSILEEGLFGRENLINSFRVHRNAALKSEDIKNGDGNVICMGGHLIDPNCLRGRTVGLELDRDVLIPQGQFNPTFFFKQQDLGYDIKNSQTVNIGDKSLIFTHTSSLRSPSLHCAALKLYSRSGELEFYGEVKKDLLISSNIKQMDQILSLNFFRFLDNLMTVNCKSASWRAKEIYDEIGKLTDEDLQLFLSDLGKKMSCSSEFNITGAYKIDLNALLSITVYDEQTKVDRISINDLCNQLNDGNFELLNRLQKYVPELLASARFLHLLQSKVQNQAALERLGDFFLPNRN